MADNSFAATVANRLARQRKTDLVAPPLTARLTPPLAVAGECHLRLATPLRRSGAII